MFSSTMRDRRDWIREKQHGSIGGTLTMHLSGREYRVEYFKGTPPVRYSIDRDYAIDESGSRVDDAEFSQIVAALTMALHDCYDEKLHVNAPTAAVFEIHFQPGMSPFGNGRRVFIEGRLADLMRDQIGAPGVTFEYPVRVDGSAPQWVRMKSDTITGLDPVA
jgi:hypothetical protein